MRALPCYHRQPSRSSCLQINVSRESRQGKTNAPSLDTLNGETTIFRSGIALEDTEGQQTHILSPRKLRLQLGHSKQQNDIKLFAVILYSIRRLPSCLGLGYTRSISDNRAYG